MFFWSETLQCTESMARWPLLGPVAGSCRLRSSARPQQLLRHDAARPASCRSVEVRLKPMTNASIFQKDLTSERASHPTGFAELRIRPAQPPFPWHERVHGMAKHLTTEFPPNTSPQASQCCVNQLKELLNLKMTDMTFCKMCCTVCPNRCIAISEMS